MYQYVIFDLDGTLAYTLQDLADAFNYALEKNGFSPYPTEDYRWMVGSGATNLLKKASKTDEENSITALKSDFYHYYALHYTDTLEPYEGMAEMLKRLQNRGIKMGVLSNKSDCFVSGILHYLYPEIHFSAMWGKKENFPVKPDPKSFEALMREMGADKQQSVYVGDSHVDVQTAKNGGVNFLGCAWGFRGKEELIKSGVLAENIADDTCALEKLIVGEEIE